jgi:hypothetical protein
MYNIDGGLCNPCRTINAIEAQTAASLPRTYSGSGDNDYTGWIAFGLFVFLNIIFNFFPLKLVWWMAKCVYCVAIGIWTGTCAI